MTSHHQPHLRNRFKSGRTCEHLAPLQNTFLAHKLQPSDSTYDSSYSQATQRTRKMSEKVKEVVIEEVDRVKELSREAAQSGAYLYPIKVFRPLSVSRSSCRKTSC